MDESEKDSIIERIEQLRNSLSRMKGEINDLKTELSNETYNEDQEFSPKDEAWQKYLDLRREFRETKREFHRLRAQIRPRTRPRSWSAKFDFDDLSDFGENLSRSLNFTLGDLSHNIGTLVSEVMEGVSSALDSLDFDIYDYNFPFRSRKSRRWKYGETPIVKKDTEVLIELTESQEKILESLTNIHLTFEQLLETTNLTVEELTNDIAILKEKCLVIQETEGNKRVIMTKLGLRTLLKNNK